MRRIPVGITVRIAADTHNGGWWAIDAYLAEQAEGSFKKFRLWLWKWIKWDYLDYLVQSSRPHVVTKTQDGQKKVKENMLSSKVIAVVDGFIHVWLK